MYPRTCFTLLLIISCFLLLAGAEDTAPLQDSVSLLDRLDMHPENPVHVREKRTLFLKKKLVGAGILGFGLGLIKGYKSAYYIPPKVHHVYLSSPPSAPTLKYVEYVERASPLVESTVIHKISPFHRACLLAESSVDLGSLSCLLSLIPASIVTSIVTIATLFHSLSHLEQVR